jgi:hypothetical protein
MVTLRYTIGVVNYTKTNYKVVQYAISIVLKSIFVNILITVRTLIRIWL